MTRKHFEAIAAELRRQRPDLAPSYGIPSYLDSDSWTRGAYDEWATVVIGLAGTLRAFNPGFNRERFVTACGLAS
jgi:hypothetical protein